MNHSLKNQLISIVPSKASKCTFSIINKTSKQDSLLEIPNLKPVYGFNKLKNSHWIIDVKKIEVKSIPKTHP